MIKPRIDVSELNITPEIAAGILEKHNNHNRTLNLTAVADLARQMMSGEFLYTHQGIAFDQTGELMDGQTRLAAIVKSGKPQTMLVFTYSVNLVAIDGTLHDLMFVFDKGRPRRPDQNIALQGVQNATLIVGICNAIRLMLTNDTTKTNEKQTLKIHDHYKNSIEAIRAVGWVKRSSLVLAVLAMFHKTYPAEAVTLATKLSTCEGLTRNSAEMALNKFILEQLPNFGGGRRRDAMERMINGCMKSLHGEEVKALCSNASSTDQFLLPHRGAMETLAR